MNVIDNILLEWSYRCPDGIVDINDPKKKAILDQILSEYNIGEIELNEADKIKIGSKVAVIKYGPGVISNVYDEFEEYEVKLSNGKKVVVPFKNIQLIQSPKDQSIGNEFEDFLATKTLEDKTKENISKELSSNQKAKIQKSASDNITNILSFLNNNSDISDILTPMTEGKSGTSLTGPGEIAIITCGKNVQKIASGFGDVIETSGKKYELKADKEIRAGGTYRPSVVRLTTALWNLKQEVFEGDKIEEYKKILGPELFNTWKDLGLVTKGKKKGEFTEIDFTTIGKEKLSKIKNFLTILREKIKSISDEDSSKPNVISVGGKEFEVSKDELDKIISSPPGDNITVKGKVVLSQESNKELQQIRQQLKILLSSKLLNSDEINLDDAIKDDFIKDVDGLIHVVNNKYTLYTQEEFKNKWKFTGIKQGNRPSFALSEIIGEISFEE